MLIKTKKNLSEKYLVWLFLVAFATVCLCIISNWFNASNAYAQNNYGNGQAVKSLNNFENADSDYATKDFWDKEFGQHDNLYLDIIEPGTELGKTGESSVYFIRDNITVEKATNAGISGLIVKGNVELYFERSIDVPCPTLTVYGADGNGAIASGCGIEVVAGNTLSVKGVGKLFARSGDCLENIESRTGIKGSDGQYTGSSPVYMIGGSGGAGGNGIGGVSAAVGSKGSEGGAGASTTPEIKEKADETEKDGNAAQNGNSSLDSAASGNITITGNMIVDFMSGNLGPFGAIKSADAGKYASHATGVARRCCGAGGAGGTGGCSFGGSALGTGGVGGGGGGAGGGGGLDYDGAPIWAQQDYALNGGGGGAGFGSFCIYTAGGLANTYRCASDINAAIAGNSASETAAGDGGLGTDMNGHEDHYKGGKGGNGGGSGYAGKPGIVRSTTLEPKNEDAQQREGRDSKIEKYYPENECSVECDGGYVDPEDGIHTYVYNEEDPNFVPEIRQYHFPTGLYRGLIDKSLYDIKIINKTWEPVYERWVFCEATVTKLNDPSSKTFNISYYLVKEIKITIKDSTLKVSKTYDGNIFVDKEDVDGEVQYELPHELEGVVDVSPVIEDFDEPNVHEKYKKINLKIEYIEEPLMPCYLSSTTVDVLYKINILTTTINNVEFAPREYKPNDNTAVITSADFEPNTEDGLKINKDFEVVSCLIKDNDITPGNYDTQYTIKLINDNVVFKESGDDPKIFTGSSSIYVDFAHIQLNSAIVNSRDFEPDNFFIDINDVEFINLTEDANFEKDVDYQIYYEDEHGLKTPNKGKIIDSDCLPGLHSVSYTVEILNPNYRYKIKGEDEKKCEGRSSVYINKIEIALNNDKTIISNRQFDIDNYEVDVQSVGFSGVIDGYDLIKGKNYNVQYAMIANDNADAGIHDVVYQVFLASDGIYVFSDDRYSAFGFSKVEILKREITVDSVECESRDYIEDSYEVDIKDIKFGNLNDGISFEKDIDYKINSCLIIDGDNNPGIHDAEYSVSLLNNNYIFENGSTSIKDITTVLINEILQPEQPEIINAETVISATGDSVDLIYVLTFIFVIALLMSAVLRFYSYKK